MTAPELSDLLELDRGDAAALLGLQTGVLELIAAGSGLQDVLTRVAEGLEELVPGCRCSILLLDPATETLYHGAAPSLPSDYSAGIDGMRIGAEAGSCGTAAYLRIPVVAEDITTDPRWQRFRHLAGRHDLRSCWSTPVSGHGGVVGTFAVYYDHAHRPTGRERLLVERLTHLASVAIDHDRLFGELTASEERFRRAFEDNTVGMALAELDGSITRVNPALRELLGRSEYELIGKRLAELFTPHTDPGTDHAAQYEAGCTRPDGRVLDVAVAVSPVRGLGGRPVHLSASVLDVTERRAAERERRRRQEAELARRVAEAASRAKTDFLSALGHELRTPLQAITGFTELLGTLDLSAERRSAALEHISAASAHILAMVDDVLDVARIEAGALPLHPVELDLADVVPAVLAMLEPLATAERVTLHRAGSAAPVRADQRRVTQVLLNLVANAIRYNRPGGSVHVETHADGVVCRVVVRDTGRGIAPEHRARLFVPFDRLGAERDEGVGLGLPLARGLAEAMGGTLSIESVPGVGSTATVALPSVLMVR